MSRTSQFPTQPLKMSTVRRLVWRLTEDISCRSLELYGPLLTVLTSFYMVGATLLTAQFTSVTSCFTYILPTSYQAVC